MTSLVIDWPLPGMVAGSRPGDALIVHTPQGRDDVAPLRGAIPFEAYLGFQGACARPWAMG